MTQNKLNPKTTKTSDETFQQAKFFDLSLDLLCVLDGDGVIQQANSAFEHIFGLSTSRIIQQRLSHLIEDSAKEDVEAILDNLHTLTNPISFECYIHGIDSSIQWFLWTIYPQPNLTYHAIGRDITPYKQMESKEYERNIFAEALLDTVLAINASLSLEQVLERILANIGKVVAYDYVNILLVNGNMAEVVGSQTRVPYNIDVKLQNRPKFSIRENDHLRFIYHKKECIIVPDIIHPPKWMMSSVTNHESGSFLGAPIVVEDKVIGVLGIFNAHEEFFTPLHARQLTTFANQVGIAIVNARLYEQSQSAAILRERQRVAKELHDSVNQELFAARTYADLLIKAMDIKPEVTKRYARDISSLIRGAVEQMRMILIELQPDTLTKTALPILIKQLAKTFSNRTGIPVDFQSNTTLILESTEQVAVYRIVQEILHNIEKHASANNVSILIHRSDSQFEVRISDDGIGFDAENLTEFQFGIRGVQERATSINANLKIDSHIGQGTTIIFTKDF